jgi:hypothetical protein
MGTKLEKNSYPAGHGPDDFQCFGPPAMTDGEFDNCKIADMGCFNQSGVDSNKYYHGAIVKSKKNSNFFTYFEWGRTGAKNPSFQFIQCSSESDAQSEFAGQLHDKNDKRGQWVQVAGKRVLQAKAGKDCYLVRPLATRSTGLPDAKTIKLNEGTSSKKPADDAGKKKDIDAKNQPKKLNAPKIDRETLSLMKDLSVATVAYTKGSMADASLPVQSAIDDGRDFLQEALKRLVAVGDNVDDQVNDPQLVHLTTLMYGRIPKKKALHSPPQDWILNKGNILLWQADLDAFESALVAETEIEDKTLESNPFGDLPIQMSWIDPKSEVGKFMYFWWPKATANRHGHIGAMKIKNMWRVERHGDHAKLIAAQEKVLAGKSKIKERPLFQPSERQDLQDPTKIKRWHDTNTALMFHGTRSVNVTGILREALRLPKNLVGVVITGAMFGGGLYFADDWKKSAGYTSMRGSYWSGGGGSVRGREAFMFAANVVCGQPYVAPGPHGYTCPPKDHHCVFGKGRVMDNRNNSGVENNEWIIFDRNQNELCYLAEFAA